MTAESAFLHLPLLLFWFTLLCAIMCYLGSNINLHNSKYLRARTAECESYMISVRLNDDHSICCDRKRLSVSYFSLALCDATLHWSNRILFSGYALCIPFLPFFSPSSPCLRPRRRCQFPSWGLGLALALQARAHPAQRTGPGVAQLAAVQESPEGRPG